jgi:hypothetical protein
MDELLRKHVNDQGLVAYATWKSNAADMSALDQFVNRYAAPARNPAQGVEEISALINADNACTIRWILQNYPTESIRDLDKSRAAARWKIGGRSVSLDEIEHKNLRSLYGWKTHATIGCAAHSCPPLRREAFTAANLDAWTDLGAWDGKRQVLTVDRTGQLAREEGCRDR